MSAPLLTEAQLIRARLRPYERAPESAKAPKPVADLLPDSTANARREKRARAMARADGPHIGLRFALAEIATCDQSIRHSSRSVMVGVCWRYTLGQPLKHEALLDILKAKGASRKNTSWEVRGQLARAGYIAPVDDGAGWILPCLERTLPPEARARPLTLLQLALPFMRAAPVTARGFIEARFYKEG